MEYCCLGSKKSTDEELNQQNYFSYLNLKKSGLSSDLDVGCQAEVVTVRRTRRVLYRYIMEKPTFEETGTGEEEDSLTILKKSNDPKTYSKKRKNIPLSPTEKSKSSLNISKSTKPIKKKMKDFPQQLIATNKSKLNKNTNGGSLVLATKSASQEQSRVLLLPNIKSKKKLLISTSRKSEKEKLKDSPPQLIVKSKSKLNEHTKLLREELSEAGSSVLNAEISTHKKKNISLLSNKQSKSKLFIPASKKSEKNEFKDFRPVIIKSKMELNECTNRLRAELSEDSSLNSANKNFHSNCLQVEENLNLFQKSKDNSCDRQKKNQTIKRTLTVPGQLNPNANSDFLDNSKIPYKKRKIFHCFTNPTVELNNSKNHSETGISSKQAEEVLENNILKKEDETSEKSLNSIPLISLATGNDANMKEATNESNYLHFQNVIGDTSKYTHSDSFNNEEHEIIEFVPEPQFIVEIYDSSETDLAVKGGCNNFLDQSYANEHITNETTSVCEELTSKLAKPESVCRNISLDQINNENHLKIRTLKTCEDKQKSTETTRRSKEFAAVSTDVQSVHVNRSQFPVGLVTVDNESKYVSVDKSSDEKNTQNITTRKCKEATKENICNDDHISETTTICQEPASGSATVENSSRDSSLDHSYYERHITSEKTEMCEELTSGSKDGSHEQSREKNVHSIIENACEEAALDLTTIKKVFNGHFTDQNYDEKYLKKENSRICACKDASVNKNRTIKNVKTGISNQIFPKSTKINIMPNSVQITDNSAIKNFLVETSSDKKHPINYNLTFTCQSLKSDEKEFTKDSQIILEQLEENGKQKDCTEFNFVPEPHIWVELKLNNSPEIARTTSKMSKTQPLHQSISIDSIKGNTQEIEKHFVECGIKKEYKINYQQKKVGQYLHNSQEEKPNASHIAVADVTNDEEKLSSEHTNEEMERTNKTLEKTKKLDSSHNEYKRKTNDLKGMFVSIQNMHEPKISEKFISKRDKSSLERNVIIKEEIRNSPEITSEELLNNEENLLTEAQRNTVHSVSNIDEQTLVKNSMSMRRKSKDADFVEQNLPDEHFKLDAIGKSKANLIGRMEKQSIKKRETKQSHPIPEIEVNTKSPSPRLIRIEKSPCRDIQVEEDFPKNDSFEKFVIFQNLSRFVQKDAESSNDCVLESDYKMEKLKFEDESEFNREPKEIEVVHYKPTTTPTQYVHNNSIRKYCKFCNVGYINSVALNKHMMCCKSNPKNTKIEPIRLFYCKFCNLGITNAVFFKQHEEKCEKELMSRTINLSSSPILEESCIKSKKKRSRIGRHACPNCDYTSDNIGHMHVHQRIHNKIPLCVCDVCHKGFNRLDVLKKHMFRHIDVAEEMEELEKESIWNGRATKITLQLKIRNKEFIIPQFKCSKCSYSTPISESMDKHFNSIHLGSPSFRCNLCSFSSKQKSNLKQHLNWHLRERTYKCSHCPYETINKTYIKKHENQVHLKTISFKCDFCEFKTYRKENLKAHVNSIHLKTKKFPCDKCDYISYVQSNLIGHIKTMHEGIKRKKKEN